MTRGEYIWYQGGEDTYTRCLRAGPSLEFNVTVEKYSLYREGVQLLRSERGSRCRWQTTSAQSTSNPLIHIEQYISMFCPQGESWLCKSCRLKKKVAIMPPSHVPLARPRLLADFVPLL